MGEFLTIPEAAERLSCCERTLREWCSHKKIKAKKVVNKWLIPEEEIDRLLGLSEPMKTKPPNDHYRGEEYLQIATGDRANITEVKTGDTAFVLLRWRDQAVFYTLHKLLYRVHLQDFNQKLEDIKAGTQNKDESYDYMRPRHFEEPLLIEEVSIPVKEEYPFQKLKNGYPYDSVWKAQESWDLAYHKYLYSFDLWLNKVQDTIKSKYNCILEAEATGEQSYDSDDLSHIEKTLAEDVKWFKLFTLASLIACCDLLLEGIKRLPPDPQWSSPLNDLEVLRNEVVHDLNSEPPEGLPTTKDDLIGMATGWGNEFWKKNDEIKAKTSDLLEYRLQLGRVQDDLHSKIKALEKRVDTGDS